MGRLGQNCPPTGKRRSQHEVRGPFGFRLAYNTGSVIRWVFPSDDSLTGNSIREASVTFCMGLHSTLGRLAQNDMETEMFELQNTRLRGTLQICSSLSWEETQSRQDSLV